MEKGELKQYFDSLFSEDKKVLLLGFGREGKSSYRVLRSLYPNMKICVADANTEIEKDLKAYQDAALQWNLGENYLQIPETADYLLKSPGISLKDYPGIALHPGLTSQTDIFLQFFHSRIVGVTGTKGKSTTTALIYHTLKTYNEHIYTAGNMGLPLFDILEEITEDSLLICELSAHQLEFIHKSPHVAILLNLYEEHLDYYRSFDAYARAKLQIARFQESEDLFLYPFEDLEIAKQIKNLCIKAKTRVEHPYSIVSMQNYALKGEHNRLNMQFASDVCKYLGLKEEQIEMAFRRFEALRHRMEYIGCYDEIHYYNDSISTIPEASIAAIEALRTATPPLEVGCLILGGYDRGIDYSVLLAYLKENPIKSIIFVGQSGKRIASLMEAAEVFIENTLFSDNYSEVVRWAKLNTTKGQACLLSPASASYDGFKNFEERGDVFATLVRNTK